MQQRNYLKNNSLEGGVPTKMTQPSLMKSIINR